MQVQWVVMMMTCQYVAMGLQEYGIANRMVSSLE